MSVFIFHYHYVPNEEQDYARSASMIMVCALLEFQQVLLAPSLQDLVEQNVEVPQALGQLWLSRCEALVYVLLRVSMWHVHNLSPTQKVRWCDKLI